MSVKQGQTPCLFVVVGKKGPGTDFRKAALCLCCIGALMLLAGCSSRQTGGLPTSAPLPIATNIETPLPTIPPMPMPTAVPLPTPLAAISTGTPPGGQVFFSTARSGETWEELWQVDAAGGLRIAQPAVAPDLWQCATVETTRCAFVTSQGALQASEPASGRLALLDDLSAPLITPARDPLTPTVSISGTAAAASFASLQLVLAPNGTALALAVPDSIDVFDLPKQSLEARLQVTGTMAVAWSPDSSLLAITYPRSDGGTSLVLWNWREGTVRTLAAMQDVGDLAWAPDGAKLAFAGRQQPLSPASQGGESDVFVVFLGTGEVANLTEVFVANNGLSLDEQLAAWAPTWVADSASVRYVRGVPDAPETQSVMRRELPTRGPTILGSTPETAITEASPRPSNQAEARLAERDGRQVVQVREAGGEWREASSGTFEGLYDLVWAPLDLPATESDGEMPGRYLLLVARQSLYILDVTNGQIGGLAVACPVCTVKRAIWLP